MGESAEASAGNLTSSGDLETGVSVGAVPGPAHSAGRAGSKTCEVTEEKEMLNFSFLRHKRQIVPFLRRFVFKYPHFQTSNLD